MKALKFLRELLSTYEYWINRTENAQDLSLQVVACVSSEPQKYDEEIVRDFVALRAAIAEIEKAALTEREELVISVALSRWRDDLLGGGIRITLNEPTNAEELSRIISTLGTR